MFLSISAFPRIFLLALMLFFLAGCNDRGSNPVSSSDSSSAPPPPPPTATRLSFKNDVLPVLESHGCVGCHGGNGGLYVGTVAQLKQGGNHGPAVTAGNAAGSVIAQKISPTPPFGARMPLGGPYLPDSVQQVIRKWIDQGALDN